MTGGNFFVCQRGVMVFIPRWAHSSTLWLKNFLLVKVDKISVKVTLSLIFLRPPDVHLL